MSIINHYPYTDMHELNLDWVIAKIRELDDKLGDELISYIRSVLDKLLLDAAYDAETETLILRLTLPDEVTNG